MEIFMLVDRWQIFQNCGKPDHVSRISITDKIGLTSAVNMKVLQHPLSQSAIHYLANKPRFRVDGPSSTPSV
jgi:hypothetical protein